MAENRTSTGLLDVAVELSSPELFAGEDFSVYLIVKNPFDRPIWVREVKGFSRMTTLNPAGGRVYW
jgi:hypothetical protein